MNIKIALGKKKIIEINNWKSYHREQTDTHTHTHTRAHTHRHTHTHTHTHTHGVLQVWIEF